MLTPEVRHRWTREQLARCEVMAPSTGDPVVRFATKELTSYLQRIVGCQYAVRTNAQLPAHVLVLQDPKGSGTGADLLGREQEAGFHASSSSVVFFGATPRQLLHAVYRFLETLGCRWSILGRTYEQLPAPPAQGFELARADLQCCFQRIGYCSDLISWHYTQPEFYRARVAEDLDLVDWMGKTGATHFFFIRHPFDTQSTVPELLPQFGDRGIEIEIGGHVLPNLLARGLFAEHPEYFPASHDGQRHDQGNMCPSNPDALAVVAREAARLLDQAGPVAALHIWGADVLGGGWCRCASCNRLTPQDQSLLVCNAVARECERRHPATRVYYLAYHDTIEPNLHVTPHPQVYCEFAPRERCYGHSMGDPACGTNLYYRTALELYQRRFENRLRVFEYYGDAILFFGCLVPIPSLIADDVAFYRNAGVSEIFFLQFGAFSRWAYAPNFTSFAASTRGRPVDDALRALWRGWHHEPERLEHLFLQLEATLRALVQYGDLRLKPKRRGQVLQLRQALEQHLPRFEPIAAALEAAGSPALHALALLVRYTQAVFEAVAYEIDTGKDGESLFRSALKFIEAIDRTHKGVWGELDLPVIHDVYKLAHLLPGWG